MTPTPEGGRLEMLCEGRPFDVHVEFDPSQGELVVTMRAEATPDVEAKPGARETEPRTITHLPADRRQEYNRHPLITRAEFERRRRAAMPALRLRQAIYLLTLLGLPAAAIAFLPHLPVPWRAVLVGSALVVPIVLGITLFNRQYAAAIQRHGLACPYCRQSFLEDWKLYRKRDRIPAWLKTRVERDSPFITGFCSRCKAEVMDIESADANGDNAQV